MDAVMNWDWTQWNLWTQLPLILVAAWSLQWIHQRVIRGFEKATEKTQNPWDDALLYAFRSPLTVAIYYSALYFALTLVQANYQFVLMEPIAEYWSIGFVLIFAWFLMRLTTSFEQNWIHQARKKGKEVDLTTVDAVSKLAKIVIGVVVFMMILQDLGYSISGLLAFGGIAGIAVGMAAKDLLSNLFGGLMIYMDRPFAVGDWVRSPDREIEGTVERIGWRMTQIRTFDKRPLYVPNSTFTMITVQNPSRMSHRRIYETVGVRYCDADKIQSIIQDVKAMILAHEDLDTTQTLIVNFNSFGASSLDFFLYTFTKTTDWVTYHSVKQDVLLKVLEIIESHQAEVAFPTTTLDLPEPVLERMKS